MHPSLPDMRGSAFCLPPKFVHKATPARLMHRARSSHHYHGKRMVAINVVSEWRLPKVSEEEDEAVDKKDWQDDTFFVISCILRSGPAMRQKENSVRDKLPAWKDAQIAIHIQITGYFRDLQ